MGSHRLVDPIVAVLSFTEGDSVEAPDLRRLERIERTAVTVPWWLHTLPPTLPTEVVTQR
jgi:hypothetical protein